MSINSINADQLKLLQSMQGVKEELLLPEIAGKLEHHFSEYFNQALQAINQHQNHSDDLKQAFELGKDVSLGELMIQSHKATLSLNALIQIRNKLIGAYKEIMSMPV